jgi:hypothetical protein
MSNAWRQLTGGTLPTRNEVQKHLVSRSLVFCALCCAVGVSTPASGSAQANLAGPASAGYDGLIEQASDAYGAKRYDQARDLFEQAHVLQPSARTFRGLGITAFALNRYTQARPELEASLVDQRKPLTREQRREVTEILNWMKQSLGSLRLELSPPHALALIDDQATRDGSNLLELGEHLLQVRATGYVPHEQTFQLERDHPLTLRVELQKEAQPPVVTAARSQLSPPARPNFSESPRDTSNTESTSVFGSWWFWTIAGVVVASSVVTVWAVSHQPEPHALPQGIHLSTP